MLEDLKVLADLERVRLLFDDLETRREVVDLLGRAEQAEGVRIFIGSENKLFSLSGSSTIVAPYHDASGQIVGVLGVIGPTRLNYARIIPMVDYTAKVVSKLLGGLNWLTATPVSRPAAALDFCDANPDMPGQQRMGMDMTEQTARAEDAAAPPEA